MLKKILEQDQRDSMTAIIKIRVKPEMKKEIEELAQNENTTVSRLTRALLQYAIKGIHK